ncbi:Os09g0459700, partial [Oryza sativa Japonica Group]
MLRQAHEEALQATHPCSNLKEWHVEDCSTDSSSRTWPLQIRWAMRYREDGEGGGRVAGDALPGLGEEQREVLPLAAARRLPAQHVGPLHPLARHLPPQQHPQRHRHRRRRHRHRSPSQTLTPKLHDHALAHLPKQLHRYTQ